MQIKRGTQARVSTSSPRHKKTHTHSLSPACFIENREKEKVWKRLSVKVSDSPERADPWAGAAPVAVPAVLAGPQVVGSSPVVGLVVQQPMAVDHVARVNVRHTQAVLDVGAVVAHLLHLTGHVGTLVQSDFVGAAVLREEHVGVRREFWQRVSVESPYFCIFLMSVFQIT